MTVFPCYAAPDKPQVCEIAEILERGTGARFEIEKGAMRAGETILDKAVQGLQSDVILLFFSAHSAGPELRSRSLWEPVLVHEPREANVKVCGVRLAECQHPAKGLDSPVFDLSGGSRAPVRLLKRKLLEWKRGTLRGFVPLENPGFSGCEEEIEYLYGWLAEGPGAAVIFGPPGAGKTELAREFAWRHRDEFEAVAWARTGERRLAFVIGELNAQLDLPLRGDVPDALRCFLEETYRRRLLVVLDGVSNSDTEAWPVGHCSSVLATTRDAGAAARRGLPQVTLRARPDACAERADVPPEMLLAAGEENPPAIADFEAALAAALRQPSESAWNLSRQLAYRGCALARAQGRLAESFEFLEILAGAAALRHDRRTQDRCAWEQIWILEGWGRTADARALDHLRREQTADQLALDFGEGFFAPGPPDLPFWAG